MLAGLPGLAGLLAACSGTPLRDQPWTRYSPMLWQATRNGRTEAWLFGTIHVGTEPLYPWPDPIEQAWRASSGVAIEIDSARHWQELVDAFRPHVDLPPGVTLDDLLPRTVLSDARQFFGWSERDWQELRRRQPWWVANFRFGTDNDRLQGAQRNWGVEQALMRRTGKDQRAVVELESVAEHVAGIAGGSLDEQCQQFQIWFDDARRRGYLLRDMLAAWRVGNAATLEALKDRMWGDQYQLSSLRQRFFTDRDQRITKRLIRTLDRSPGAEDPRPPGAPDSPMFVAIGAFHLVGPDSVPVALSRAGFTMTRVGDT